MSRQAIDAILHFGETLVDLFPELPDIETDSIDAQVALLKSNSYDFFN